MSQEISRNSSVIPEGHIAVFSEQPSKVETGNVVIEFRRKKMEQAQSYRAVIVPTFAFSAVYEPATMAETFGQALTDAVMQAASDVLRSYCDEHKEAISIPAETMQLASVVARMAEDQTAQRLNSEQIGTWYDSSKTKTDAIARYKTDEKKVNLLREKYQSLASNNAGILPDLAQKMTAYVNEEDASHPVCKAILRRLDRIQKQTVSSDEL